MTHPAPPSAEQAQAIAERVRDGMYAKDAAARSLGMTVTDIGAGHATVTMPVRPDMLNGFGICHGGLIATLADTAFAYACNSHNELTVASGFEVNILAPGKPGDLLTACATVASQGTRMGVYDVEVHNQAGVRIALFRGRSYRMKSKAVVDSGATP